jgi:hypothetical protein
MAAEHLVTVYGTAVMVCRPDGIPIDTEGAAVELLGEAIGLRAEVVVVPTERLTDDFFELQTGVGDDIAQRFATYEVRLVIVGDLSDRVTGSPALSAWIAESNSGTRLWFCDTFEDFQVRLDRRKASRAM